MDVRHVNHVAECGRGKPGVSICYLPAVISLISQACARISSNQSRANEFLFFNFYRTYHTQRTHHCFVNNMLIG
jgi:hypothetical protein